MWAGPDTRTTITLRSEETQVELLKACSESTLVRTWLSSLFRRCRFRVNALAAPSSRTSVRERETNGLAVAALIPAQRASQSQLPVLLMRKAPDQSVGQGALHEPEYYQDSGNPQSE